MILTNPVVIAVIVLLVLCFLRVNVLLSLVIASIVAGLVSGMDIKTTMGNFISGCGNRHRLRPSGLSGRHHQLHWRV